MKKRWMLTIAGCSLFLFAICQDSTIHKDSTAPGYPVKDTSSSAVTSVSMNGSLSRNEKDAIAKNLKPADGKALIYVIRPSWAAMLIKMDVRVDGVHIGGTKADTYVYAMLDPGKHVLMSASENHATINIVVEAGKTYYFRQEVEMGAAYAETDLTALTEEQGLKYLKKCKLAKDNVGSN